MPTRFSEAGGWQSAPSRTRTCDNRFRKPVLYPPELWGLHVHDVVTRPTASEKRSGGSRSPSNGERDVRDLRVTAEGGREARTRQILV